MRRDDLRLFTTLTATPVLVLALVATSAGGALSAESGGIGAAVDELLARVPESHREACRPDMDHDQADALMTVRCELESGITVIYSQLVSDDAVSDRYAARLAIQELERDRGDCSEALPGEESYTIGGEPIGRVLCYNSFGYDSFHWTHAPSGIYAQAIFEEGDLSTLWSWWANESGPVEPSADATAAGVGAAVDALLSHVPDSHRDTCLPFDGGGLEDGVEASVKCEVAPDLTVYYDQHVSASAMADEYRDGIDRADVEEATGDCSEAVPGETSYTIADVPAGRLLCKEFLGSTWFTWTHEPTAISATISSDRGVADTWAWWVSDSGPVD